MKKISYNDKNMKPTDAKKIEESLKFLNRVGLTRAMIVNLIQADTKLAKYKINKVLDSLLNISKTIEKNREGSE